MTGDAGGECAGGCREDAGSARERHPLVGVLVDTPGGLGEHAVVERGERWAQDECSEDVGAIDDRRRERGERGEDKAGGEHGGVAA